MMYTIRRRNGPLMGFGRFDSLAMTPGQRREAASPQMQMTPGQRREAASLQMQASMTSSASPSEYAAAYASTRNLDQARVSSKPAVAVRDVQTDNWTPISSRIPPPKDLIPSPLVPSGAARSGAEAPAAPALPEEVASDVADAEAVAESSSNPFVEPLSNGVVSNATTPLSAQNGIPWRNIAIGGAIVLGAVAVFRAIT